MESEREGHPNTLFDFHWRPIRLGLSLVLVFIVATDLPLTGALVSAWRLAWAGSLCWFVSKIVMAQLARMGKLLRGAMIALLYFALTVYRPIPPMAGRAEWQHPSLAVGDATLDEFIVHPLAADGAGGLWFGYKNLSRGQGIGRLNPGVGSEDRWQIHPARISDGRPGAGFVLSLLPDGQQGVWVGSLHGGLSYYDSQTAGWQTIPGFNGDVLAMVADGAGLWLATFGDGVAHYDPASHNWTMYTTASTGGGLQDDEVTELIADGAGGLWAGTYGGGISHYDPDRDEWQPFTVASTGGGLSSDDVRTLVVDEAGTLWVGTFGGGISRYNPHNDTWVLYTSETTGSSLASNHVLTLLPARDGRIWAGLSNLDDQGGLGYFDGQAWQTYTVASTGGGLLSDDVRTLAADGDGGVWVGTQGGGLSHLAADRQTWTTFTVESTGGGLADDTVLALMPDDADGLWIGMGNGLGFVSWVTP